MTARSVGLFIEKAISVVLFSIIIGVIASIFLCVPLMVAAKFFGLEWTHWVGNAFWWSAIIAGLAGFSQELQDW